MKKITLIVLFILLFPACAYAEPVAESPSIQIAETTDSINSNVLNVGSGIPPVSQEELDAKANNMVNSLHQLAMKVSPQLVVVVLIIGAVFGVFLQAARRIIIFALIGLTLIYWAPMIVSLWVQFIQ